MNRRTVLKGGLVLAATGHTAVAVEPPAVTAAAAPDTTSVAPVEENPDLVQAYNDVVAARAELEAARNALEWLRDEWRHRWPLAPEQILGIANANRDCDNDYAVAETDIAGELIYRETSGLTLRFSNEMREKMPRTCFAVVRCESIQDVIAGWEKPRTGRTPKALARNIATQTRVLKEYREKLRLAKGYHDDVARIRAASGVEQAKRHIDVARGNLQAATNRVSRIPARTHYGLRVKACALANGAHFEHFVKCSGPLGEMARLVNAVLALPKEAQA